MESATSAEPADNGAYGRFSRMARMFAVVSSSQRSTANAPGVFDPKSSGWDASSLDDEEEYDDRGDGSWSARGDGDTSRLLLSAVREGVVFHSPSDVDYEVEVLKSVLRRCRAVRSQTSLAVYPQRPFVFCYDLETQIDSSGSSSLSRRQYEICVYQVRHGVVASFSSCRVSRVGHARYR